MLQPDTLLKWGQFRIIVNENPEQTSHSRNQNHRKPQDNLLHKTSIIGEKNNVVYHDAEETAIICQILVDEDGLQGIASGRVICLTVYRQSAGKLNICRRVHVHVTNSICMSHHRNPGVVLNVLHQSIAASRNHLQDVKIEKHLIGGLLL